METLRWEMSRRKSNWRFVFFHALQFLFILYLVLSFNIRLSSRYLVLRMQSILHFITFTNIQSLMNVSLLICHLQVRGHDTHSTVTRIYQGEYRDDTVLSEEKALEQIEIWNHAE